MIAKTLKNVFLRICAVSLILSAVLPGLVMPGAFSAKAEDNLTGATQTVAGDQPLTVQQAVYGATQLPAIGVPFGSNGKFTDLLDNWGNVYSKNSLTISGGSASGIGGDFSYYSEQQDFKSISIDVTYNKWALNFTDTDELSVYEAVYDSNTGGLVNGNEVTLVRQIQPQLMSGVQYVKATYVSTGITPGTRFLRIEMPESGYFTSSGTAADFKVDAVALENVASVSRSLDGYIVDRAADFSKLVSGSDTSNLLVSLLNPDTQKSPIQTFGTQHYIKRKNSNVVSNLTYAAPSGKNFKSAYVEGYYYQSVPSTPFELWTSQDGTTYTRYNISGLYRHPAFGSSTYNLVPDVLQANYLPDGIRYIQVRLPAGGTDGFPYMTMIAFGYGPEVEVQPIDTDILIGAASSGINIDGVVETDGNGNATGDWAGSELLRITGVTDNNGDKHAADIYLKYDTERLYIGAKIKDPTPMKNRNTFTNIWNGDALELFLGDEDLDYTAYPDKTGTMLPSDRQLVLSGGSDLGYQYYLNWKGVLSAPPLFMEIRKDADGKGYTIEAALPLDAAGWTKPWEGKPLIMNAVLNDGDYASRGQWGWTTEGEAAKKARGNWGRAALTPSDTPAEQMTLTASVNNATQEVTVVGTVYERAVQEMSLMVKNPDGSIIHLDQAATDVQGEFTFRYNLRTDVSGNGVYTVTVGGANILLPHSASFLFTYEETSEITPTLAAFDKNMEKQADISVDMNLKGNTLLAVRQGELSLVPGSDYRIDDSRVTLTKNYLNTLPVGTSELTLSFNAGLDANLTLNIVDTTPSNDATLKNISISNGILVPTFSPERSIHLGLVDKKKDSWVLTVSANDMKVKSITVNGTPVQSGAADYTISFKKAGLYTIVVTAEDGVTTRTYTLAVLKVSKVKKPHVLIEKLLAKVLDRYSSDVHEMSRNEAWVSELEAFIQGQ
jgi:hypothetical protein